MGWIYVDDDGNTVDYLARFLEHDLGFMDISTDEETRLVYGQSATGEYSLMYTFYTIPQFYVYGQELAGIPTEDEIYDLMANVS